jgi:hypothetical protein
MAFDGPLGKRVGAASVCPGIVPKSHDPSRRQFLR